MFDGPSSETIGRTFLTGERRCNWNVSRNKLRCRAIQPIISVFQKSFIIDSQVTDPLALTSKSCFYCIFHHTAFSFLAKVSSRLCTFPCQAGNKKRLPDHRGRAAVCVTGVSFVSQAAAGIVSSSARTMPARSRTKSAACWALAAAVS